MRVTSGITRAATARGWRRKWDFFFPRVPQTDLYWQPRGLDPGDWQISVNAHAVRLVNRLTHRFCAEFNAEVALEMTKSVSPALNPLRQERMRADISDVEYAGYTLRTSLAWTNEVRGGPVGLWNLTQMPHGGDLLVPTCCPSQPRVLFGNVEFPRTWETQEHLIRYAMRDVGRAQDSDPGDGGDGTYRLPLPNCRRPVGVDRSQRLCGPLRTVRRRAVE